MVNSRISLSISLVSCSGVPMPGLKPIALKPFIAAAMKGFNAMGFNPGIGTPEQLTRLIDNDMRLFTTVIRERNLKFDG